MNSNVPQAKNLRLTGSAVSHGGEFLKVRIMGDGTVNGDLKCSRLRVLGQLEVAGALYSETVRILGQVSVKGDCNAESFYTRGVFTIDGELNTGNLEVRLFGPCQAKEIGGGKIRIRRNLRGSSATKYLVVDSVEGDDIYLECTRAKVVRGNRVVIGQGCDIGLVEYHHELRQSRQATVRQSTQV